VGRVTVSERKSITIYKICLQYNQFTPELKHLTKSFGYKGFHFLSWCRL